MRRDKKEKKGDSVHEVLQKISQVLQYVNENKKEKKRRGKKKREEVRRKEERREEK